MEDGSRPERMLWRGPTAASQLLLLSPLGAPGTPLARVSYELRNAEEITCYLPFTLPL